MKKFNAFLFIFIGGSLLAVGAVLSSNFLLGTTLEWWAALPGCFLVPLVFVYVFKLCE